MIMNPGLLEKLNKLKEEYPELENQKISFLNKEPTFLAFEEPKFCVNHPSNFMDVIAGPSPKIQVRKSPVHGYGVFAKETIHLGEQIEEARLIRLALRAGYQFDKVLNDHVFSLSKCHCKECEAHGKKQFVGLGFASIYNHSEESNAKFSIDLEFDILKVKAIKEIKEGEEIFTNYGKEYWLMRKIWHGLRLNA